MAEETNISWADHTFNPIVGCTRVSPACDACLLPDTPVLMADGGWKPISSLTVGDLLHGCVESGTKKGRGQYNCTSTVDAIWATRSETITIRTASGRSATCSPNHLWLTRLAGRVTWKRADELTIGSLLLGFGNPSKAIDVNEPEYQRGYFAGATAGDGTMRYDPSWRSDKLGFPQMYWRIAVLETDRAILDRMHRFLASAGVITRVKPFSNGDGYQPMLKLECRAKGDLEVISNALVDGDSPSWKAGWLAGFLDTDGFCSKSTKAVVYRWSQLDDRNGYLSRTQQYLTDLGFRSTLERRPGYVMTVVLNAADIEEKAALVGAIMPALARKGMKHLYGMKHPAVRDRVISLEWGPESDLIDITTSSKTFVAGGLSTHNCYAAHLMETRMGRVTWGGPGKGVGTRVRTSEANWRKPLTWDRKAAKAGNRPFVFCASLADVFDNQWQVEWRRDLFDLIVATPNLVWLLLTKRPQNIVDLSVAAGGLPKNVAFGTTVEDQKRFDINVPHLREAKRILNPSFAFLSCEPLLGPLEGSLDEIDWCITGGETDQGEGKARPTNPDWFRSLRDRCADLKLPYHHKQNGEWVHAGHPSITRATENLPVDHSLGRLMVKVGKKRSGRELDGVEHNGFPSIRRVS